jgi:hypothetical protein
VAFCGADEVDDQAVALVGKGARAAADHLHVEDPAAGGAGDDHAVDRRLVEALGEHGAVGDDLRFATAQAGEDRAPLFERQRPVDCLRRYLAPAERIGHEVGELHRRREQKRPSRVGDPAGARRTTAFCPTTIQGAASSIGPRYADAAAPPEG